VYVLLSIVFLEAINSDFVVSLKERLHRLVVVTCHALLGMVTRNHRQKGHEFNH